jgi:aminoglycoside phosphotransferase (APT) family kinase protein
MTRGVVRVGGTVRRPVGAHSTFIHALLGHLERVGFNDAPRLLGIDNEGREMLSYIEGDVPSDLDARLTDGQLTDAAHLLRRYHDATAGSTLAGGEEVVCHNDISPVNTVFVAGRPSALIDFDGARPGPRIRDVSYGMFLWLNLGWDGPGPAIQRHRIEVWCDAYGLDRKDSLIDEVEERVSETAIRLGQRGMEDAAGWWQRQFAWLEQHHHALAE